jgi:hypothetical protein
LPFGVAPRQLTFFADIVVVQGTKAARQNLLSIQAEVFGPSLADYRHDSTDC